MTEVGFVDAEHFLHRETGQAHLAADNPATRGDVALVSRHFADVGDILEDPFTGSASGGMAAYCAHYGLIEERSYKIAQGDHMGRPGRGYIGVIGDGDAIEAVEVGGEAVMILRGTLSL